MENWLKWWVKMYINKRNKEDIDFFRISEKYPHISRFIILKIELQRRGVVLSDQALKRVNIEVHQTKQRSFSRESEDNIPVSLMLRDGTMVVTRPTVVKKGKNKLNPILVDVEDEKLVLKDSGEVLEEVFYWEKPDYYEKKTSRGIPMWQIASARPQRIDINPYQFCDFWKIGKYGCKFCEIASTYYKQKKPCILNLDDIRETVKEALKEKGRYTSVFMTGGTCLSGNELFDDEVDLYIKILQEIGNNFSSFKFPSQLIGSAYSKNQLNRLYKNTGLMSYTADLEVLDEKMFEWICPGKAHYVGYNNWKERLYQAVDIFGKGYVNTGIVSGIELASPNGFKIEEEGIRNTLLEAEELFRNGVSVVSCVWRIAPGSIFASQRQPSLDYYVQVADGLNKLNKKYGGNNGMDDYRRCGNHPNTDLARIW